MTELITIEMAFAVTALILLLLIVLIVRLIRRSSRTAQPRVKARPPMDRHRRDLYRALRRALPRQVILAQVPYGQFLLPSGLSKAKGKALRLQLDSYLADYLICSEALVILAVVALDDNANRDQEQLLKEAGLPLIRWHSAAPPEVGAIREAIQPLLTTQAPRKKTQSAFTADTDSGRTEPTLGNTDFVRESPERQEPKL